jgi:hypothetical protein
MGEGESAQGTIFTLGLAAIVGQSPLGHSEENQHKLFVHASRQLDEHHPSWLRLGNNPKGGVQLGASSHF